ncbi:DUF481 domain-containing protein [Agarilytica rhodophyticola]|uniref:DUF481 domain-containing protein n=1 Tax=Agarilytica rhodophyticola TaxID=1737490 RepID=UPI000B348895|nr:DUF481 domain-containing protein [Agarilytica rhodophyticola]
MNKLFTLLILSALSSFAVAQEEEEKKPLEIEAEFGLSTTSGNTSTQTFKSRLEVKQDLENWRNKYVLQSLFTRNEVEDDQGELVERTAAEKYFGSAQGDYKLNKDNAAFFIFGEYDRNRFSGFEYQYTVALGYSDRLFTTDNSYLSYNIGPGVTVIKEEDDETTGMEMEAEETFVVRFLVEYVYQISENSKFTQNINTNYSPDSDENTKTRAITALTAQLNSSFALRASFTVDYNSQVPEEREHADTETAVTIVYSF